MKIIKPKKIIAISVKRYKYEEIIEYVTSSIEAGIIPKGRKLPSLRKVRNQFNCAMSVAMQAYQELEMQGVIKSVEKSGYFVKPPILRPIPIPQTASYSLRSAAPTHKSIISRVIDLSNDKKMVSLGAGIPAESILPVKKLEKIISRNAKEKPELLCTYTPAKGNVKLRQALVSFLFNKGLRIIPEEIIITNGCMEALSLAIRATTCEGDIVAIENPVFFGLINLLWHLKRKVIEIPTDPIQGMDLAVLEQVAKKNDIKLCLVSASFQNPLGFIMPEENKLKLIELAKKMKFTIVEDDIYGDTGYTPKTYRPISYYDKENKVIYCSSFSKSISPGLRIGWILPGKYMDKCAHMKFSESIGGPNLVQQAMADFLTDGGYDYFIKLFRKKLAAQLQEIKEAIIISFPQDIKISNPQGGYFLWVELASHIDTTVLFEKAIERGVGIVPGVAFTTSNRYKNCLRISCGAPVSDKIMAAIEILGELIRSCT